jgi:uncharacterized alkaline shock family protein YloU
MKVYALIGPSGTGKSHRSTLVAYQEGIEYIIDDGLLIRGHDILAGRSAKRENTRIGATKRAVFFNPEHAEQMREKIKEVRPESILVLGISRRMVELITKRLDIPAPEIYFDIENIATPQEIAKALEIREKENRHVIPLPTFAIEKEFPGYFLDPLKSFLKGKNKPSHQSKPMEHCIVRPLFSSLGNYYLSENVIEQIAVHVAEEAEGVIKAKKTTFVSNKNGITISLDLIFKYGEINIPVILRDIQKKVKEELESLTGCQIYRVNVFAKRVVLQKKNKQVVSQKYIELRPKEKEKAP